MAANFENDPSTLAPSLREAIAAEARRILPVERAETLPASWYTAPEFDALDRALILANSWQYVGWESKAENPGDWFLAEVAGKPLIIVRGTDNKLRAFFNVCRHRGGPLATTDGSGRVLQCRYHGWSYSLDGRLAGAPHFEGVDGFDRKNCKLAGVHLDTWEGLVFVNLAEKPAHKLDEIFAGARDRTAQMPIAKKKFHRRIVYQAACNWKVYMDNYLEGYHVPFVHPGLTSVLEFDKYETEIHPHYVLQYSPFSDANPYAGPAGATPESANEVIYYCVYPNFMINLSGGRLQVNLVVPKGPNRTEIVFDYFYDDPDAPGASNQIARDIEFSDVVQAEDIAICEQVQRGLESGVYDRGRICVTYEHGMHHFQNLFRKAYDRPEFSRA
jgi:choline monooxygenase